MLATKAADRQRPLPRTKTHIAHVGWEKKKLQEVREYLAKLVESSAHFSWPSICEATGVPESTIRSKYGSMRNWTAPGLRARAAELSYRPDSTVDHEFVVVSPLAARLADLPMRRRPWTLCILCVFMLQASLYGDITLLRSVMPGDSLAVIRTACACARNNCLQLLLTEGDDQPVKSGLSPQALDALVRRNTEEETTDPFGKRMWRRMSRR